MAWWKGLGEVYLTWLGCLLLEANLPKQLWPYAVLASVYITNRCYNSRLGKTPFEALTGKRPNNGNMHVFGSTCFTYVQNAKKLHTQSKNGVFMRYDRESPAYLVYYPEKKQGRKGTMRKILPITNGRRGTV